MTLILPKLYTWGAHSWRQTRLMSRRGGRVDHVGEIESLPLRPFVLRSRPGLRSPQRLLRGVDLALPAPQRGVDLAPIEERLVGSPLDDDALIEHENLVRADDGR